MRRGGSWCGVLLAALLVTGSFAPYCLAADVGVVGGRVDGDVIRLVEAGDIPSLHICVVSGDEKWVKGYGEQADVDTVFLVGSVQKVFVAVSILQLYETGVIGLDDDVNKYLPFSVRHPEYPDTPITVRMILSHRSGLTATLLSEFCFDWDGLYHPDWPGYYSSSVVGVSLEEWLAMNLLGDGVYYSTDNWVHEPGSQYSYSNVGYKILMCILERVTDQSIQEYMDERIFTPLKMDHTGFDGSDFMEEHADPHTRRYGDAANVELPVWNGRYMLRSTVSDMGNLMIALIHEGAFEGYQILEKETVELMFTNTRSSNILHNLVKRLRRGGYGLGIEVCNHGLLGHGGSSVGFTAEFYINPSSNIGYVRLSNVNAILDYTSTEWKGINEVTDQMRTNVLTELGLLPRVDYIIIISTLSISVAILIRLRARLSRKTQDQPGVEDAS